MKNRTNSVDCVSQSENGNLWCRPFSVKLIFLSLLYNFTLYWIQRCERRKITVVKTVISLTTMKIIVCLKLIFSVSISSVQLHFALTLLQFPVCAHKTFHSPGTEYMSLDVMLLLCVCFICPNVSLFYQTNSMKVETLTKPTLLLEPIAVYRKSFFSTNKYRDQLSGAV